MDHPVLAHSNTELPIFLFLEITLARSLAAVSLSQKAAFLYSLLNKGPLWGITCA